MRSLVARAVLFGAILSSLILVGCGPKDEPVPADTASPSAAATPASGTGGGGVAPIGSGAAGGMTPVAGGESVDGAGMGGIGSAAKDMARGAAAKSSAGPAMGGEGGE